MPKPAAASGRKYTLAEARMQIPRASDAVVDMIQLPFLGDQLKAALRGRVEIDNATVTALNEGGRAVRLNTILNLIAGEVNQFNREREQGVAGATELPARHVESATPAPRPTPAPAATVASKSRPEQPTTPPPKIDPNKFR